MLLGGMPGMGNPSILVTPLTIKTLCLHDWWQNISIYGGHRYGGNVHHIQRKNYASTFCIRLSTHSMALSLVDQFALKCLVKLFYKRIVVVRDQTFLVHG